MRLRTILSIMLSITAIAPLAIFWFWPQTHAIQSEIREVQEKNLVIAGGIARSIDRYHSNLLTGFNIAINRPASGSGDSGSGLNGLLNNLHITSICSAGFALGEYLKTLHGAQGTCSDHVPENLLSWIKSELKNKASETVLTDVVDIHDGTTKYNPVMLLLARKADQIFIGTVSTGYLVDIANGVSFGDEGFATIIDKNGAVISHPVEQIQNARINISNNSAAKQLLDGKNGVDRFFSSALNTEVVSGYAAANESGWGVMVSQPLGELEEKTSGLKQTALAVMVIGLVFGLLFALFAARIFLYPIEQMVQAMSNIGNGDLRAYEKIKVTRLQPMEFADARNSIKVMADKLQENIDTISRHAYLDGVTGLPNRECFRVLAQEEIEKLSISGGQGAIMFLDLDGFKKVNDVYGHRSGDDLLSAFAAKLQTYCGAYMKRHAAGYDKSMTVLPARLGGDEFVLFLGNIEGAQTPADFASGLFVRVFGEYKLHNGIELHVSGSVGGALFPAQANDFDELLRLADIAMYEAKNSGKGRYCLHSSLDEFEVDSPFIDAANLA